MAARREPQEDHFEEKRRRHRTSTSCDPCRSAKQKCTVLPNMMDYSSRTNNRKESTASAGTTNLTCIRCHIRGIPCIFSRSGTVKIANDNSGFHNIAPAKKRLITTQGSPEISFKVSRKNSEARMLSMRESSSSQRTRMGRKNSISNEVRMSNPAHRVKSKDRHHSLPSKGASSRSEYGLDADESGILQPAELVENVSSFSAELGSPELRLNHEFVEGAIESERMNDDNSSLRSGHLSGSRVPSRTHRRDTWFPRLVAIFQSYSSFNTSWRQEARFSADLGSDAERSKSDSTESLQDILAPYGEETLHKLQNRSLHLFVALEPCLPPLSDLDLSSDDDQLLIAVLLACTAHVNGDQYLEAQHFGQMVRYCMNRAEKSIPFGIRGLNDVIALRLMAQNAPLFFPDNASSIAALPAHIVFSVAAEALSHRKRSFPPMSHRYHAECIQMCTIALHDTIVILGEDTLQDSTAATRCFSCSNCLGEGALTDVERFILAKKRLCDADWDSFGRHKHGNEIPFSSDGTCGTSTQLLFLRLANVRIVHSHCQSFARLFASADDEKISGMGMEAISLEAKKAFKDIGYQLDEANDLIRLVLRKTTNATARFLMKFVEIELINVHYSAMSQLIKTMLRPFAILLGTPQSSIQFFRALHFDQSMKEIMVTLGTARINMAKKMCHKLIAFERLARNHARSGDVLLKLSEMPLKAKQADAQNPADRLPSRTDATHRNARSVTFAEVSMLLHSCNGSLCVNLTSASKALCEWISGRWFAGHLPSEESEWLEWHNILSIIEQAASSFESFDPLLGSRVQAQINGSSVYHPICVTARILRRFASTLETWIEAAGDSVYSDLFRAVELKDTPPSQGFPKDSNHNSSLSIKSFARETNEPQGMQDSSNLHDAPEIHESQITQDTIDAAKYNQISSSDALEQANPSSCHDSFRPYTADELFDILNTPIIDFFLCST